MKLTFRTKLFLPLIISWLCLLTVISFNVMRDRSLRMDERKTQIANAGDMALSLAKEFGALAAAGVLPEVEAKKQALGRIKALRYGESGYMIVINDQQVLMHPIKAELIGSPVDKMKDPEGRYVYLEALKSAQGEGRGYSYFLWPKPGKTVPEPKIAFNVHYQP